MEATTPLKPIFRQRKPLRQQPPFGMATEETTSLNGFGNSYTGSVSPSIAPQFKHTGSASPTPTEAHWKGETGGDRTAHTNLSSPKAPPPATPYWFDNVVQAKTRLTKAWARSQCSYFQRRV